MEFFSFPDYMSYIDPNIDTYRYIHIKLESVEEFIPLKLTTV